MKKEGIPPNRLTTYQHRKLPHWQVGGCWYFITFRSALGPLPDGARDILKQVIISGHGGAYALAVAVVMPDHVHLLLRPNEKERGIYYSLREILKPLKGTSARRINKLLGRTGTVWQKESFDRMVRDGKEWLEKYEYIRGNAVKEILAERPEDYSWLIAGEKFLNRY